MAISKVVYKSSPSATPVTWMDATSATAAASDITAPKTAMLADGVMTTGTGSGGTHYVYVPITATETVNSARVRINEYGVAAISTPTGTNLKIYPVTSGKTYKVIGYCDNTANRPLLIVADSVVTSGTVAAEDTFDYELGTNSTAQDEEQEYTALRTGYMYLNTDSNCGLWEKTESSGADYPIFTVTMNQSTAVVSSITCDKTYSECLAYAQAYTFEAIAQFIDVSTSELIWSSGASADDTPSNAIHYYVDAARMGVSSFRIEYASDGTLTYTAYPIPRRDSTDLSASTLTVTAPYGYYPNAATITLTDSNLAASNIKNGVSIFGVMGTYGGSTSNWTLMASAEYTVNTTDTTATRIENINLTLSDYNDKNVVVWVHIRDKAGKRSGYFYGHDEIFISYSLANGATTNIVTRPYMLWYVDSNGNYTAAQATYGVYARGLYYTSDNHYVEIFRRYNSSYGTINGTFKVEVYKLTMPTGVVMFN